MHSTKNKKTRTKSIFQQDYTVVHFLYLSDVNFDHGVVALQIFGLPKTQNTTTTGALHSAA